MDELPRTAAGPLLAFLAVESTADDDGFIAAWMVTDARGYPLEFRATTPVRPSLVQRTLYGERLEHYVGVELCGKQLVEQSQRKPAIVMVPETWLLDVAEVVDVEMAAIWRAGETLKVEEEGPGNAARRTLQGVGSQLVYETRLTNSEHEGAIVRQLEECAARFDLIEAFARMRTALELLAKEDSRYA